MGKRAVALIFLIREQPPLYADVSSLPWSLLDHQPRAEALCPVQSPVYSSSSRSTLHGTARVKTPWSLPSLAVAHGNKRVAAGRFGMLLMLRVPVDKSAIDTVVSPLGRAGPAPPAGRATPRRARVLDGLSARRRERLRAPHFCARAKSKRRGAARKHAPGGGAGISGGKNWAAIPHENNTRLQRPARHADIYIPLGPVMSPACLLCCCGARGSGTLTPSPT